MDKKPAETTGMRYKNVTLVTRKQKRMGPVGCFGHIENNERQSLGIKEGEYNTRNLAVPDGEAKETEAGPYCS